MLDFPATPAIGQVFSVPGGGNCVWDGTKWAAGAANFAATYNNIGRNIFHNGNFIINQTGTSSWAFPSATGPRNSTTIDRWAVPSSPNDTGTLSVITLTDADRAAIGNEWADIAVQVQFTGTSAANSLTVLCQRTEWIRRYAGKQLTVSFWARATSGTPRIGVNIQQAFGTGGSAGTNVLMGTTPALTTAWTRYVLTGTVLSVAGKTVGAGAILEIDFFLSCNNATFPMVIGVQSGTVQFWGMQLEEGPLVTPFEKTDPLVSLQQCQRFYYQGVPSLRGAVSGTPPATSTSISRLAARHPVPMRTAPTMNIVTPLPIYDGTQTSTVGNPVSTSVYATDQWIEFDGITAAALNCGRPAIVYQGLGGLMTVSADL